MNLKYKTFLVVCDGEPMGYIRGPRAETLTPVLRTRYGDDLTGIRLKEIDGPQLLLDLIREGVDTRQKLSDRTGFSANDLMALLNLLRYRKQAQCHDSCWSAVDDS